MQHKADPTDMRRGARTLLQGFWATLVVVLADFGVDLPGDLPSSLLLIGVPVLAGALSWVANEWEDSPKRTLRAIARILSGWSRE